MKVNFKNISAALVIGVAMIAPSCSDSEPGLEYMPDMYRSPSIEAYVDYGQVRNYESDSIANTQSAKVPPVGTLPYKGMHDMQFNLPYSIGLQQTSLFKEVGTLKLIQMD